MSIDSIMPSNYLILCHPFPFLPSIFPSIRVFSSESTLCITWPKHWSFGFSINPSNEHPGLISLRMDWLDLLVVQVILKSLLQHHSSKASILWHSAFFIVQLSHPYMHTEIQISSLHDFLFKSFENCYLLLANYPHPLDHRKNKRIPEKTSTSASLTMVKPLCGSQKTRKLL